MIKLKSPRKHSSILTGILIVAVLITIIITILFSIRELNSLEVESDYQVSQVEQNVKVTLSFAETMRIVSEQHFEEESVEIHDDYNQLIYDINNSVYYLEDKAGTKSLLVGSGEIPQTEEEIDELELAFKFLAYFEQFYKSTGNVTWVYYISSNDFIAMYPSDYTYSIVPNTADYYSQEYYFECLPENNPEHELVWSDVYIDRWGMGEIITLSMPIYDGEEFKGVLAIDRSIDDIEALFQSRFDTYIMEQDGDVLATNTNYLQDGDYEDNESSLDAKDFEIILHSNNSEGSTRYLNGQFVYTRNINYTDWTYVTAISFGDLIFSSFLKTLPITVSVIILALIYSYRKRKKIQEQLLEENEALEQSVALRTEEIRLTQEATIEAVTSLTESRDDETGNHTLRTKMYAELLARSLSETYKYRDSMTPGKIRDISQSAPLHDIGKVGISDSILLKPGKLTDEEYSEMKLHTEIGANALTKASLKIGANSFLDFAIEMARSHHEKWDGTGYPLGLKGEEIPVAARIMAVADVYDALRSDRVYKKAMSHDQASKILIADSGKHFDPDVVESFIKMAYEFNEISEKYKDKN